MIDAINEITKEELNALAENKLLVNKWLYDNPADLFKKIQDYIEIDHFSLLSFISALNAGFHIILYGPPGTGKTTLSEIIPKLLYRAYPDMNTASSDWNVGKVIGGRNIQYAKKPDGGYQELIVPTNGVITDGIIDCYQKMLLTEDYITTFTVIDEFNRTDMDACLGPLFTALGSENKVLKLAYQKGFNQYLHEIIIPNRFRMICSMNKYDRTFTSELSEALTRRFKWIFIGPPEDRQKENALIINLLTSKKGPLQDVELPEELIEVPDYESIQYFEEEVLAKLNQIINDIRVYLPLGTSFLIDAYKIAFHYFKIRRGLMSSEISLLGIDPDESEKLLKNDTTYRQLLDNITDQDKKQQFANLLAAIFTEVIDAALCMTVIPACEALVEEPDKLDEVKMIVNRYPHSFIELQRVESI